MRTEGIAGDDRGRMRTERIAADYGRRMGAEGISDDDRRGIHQVVESYGSLEFLVARSTDALQQRPDIHRSGRLLRQADEPDGKNQWCPGPGGEGQQPREPV